MSTDLTMLVAAAILVLGQLGLYAAFAIPQMGARYAAGPRDEARPLSGVAARLKRAYVNLLETLPVFAIAVIVIHLCGKGDATTALASQVYVGARVAYVPAYGFGHPWLRSLTWWVGTVAIAVLLIKALV